MRLDTLLPRPLSPETDAESPSILTCLLSGIHLDRRRARGLGWGQGVALVPRQPALQQPVLQRRWLQFRCDFRLQCWLEPALQRLLPQGQKR